MSNKLFTFKIALVLVAQLSYALALSLGHCAAQEIELPGAWQEVASPVTASLRGVDVVDEQVAWASGAEGSVLRSTDAGLTWEKLNVAGHAATDFRDVQGFDAQNAVIMAAGKPPVILRTEDGGATWNEALRHPNPEAFFDAIAFLDEQRGMALADPIDGRIELYETNDAGRNWTHLPFDSRPECSPTEHAYAASGTSLTWTASGDVVIGLGGPGLGDQENRSRVLIRKADSATWSSVAVPMPGSETEGIFSVRALPNDRLVIVGGDYQLADQTHQTAAWSLDQGASWNSSSSLPTGFRSAVDGYAVGEQWLLICCGPNGSDFSIDQGLTWQALGDQGFHALAFSPDGKTGIAVGAAGRIAKWIPAETSSR